MAIVKIKNAEVTRLNNTGNGVKVTESNESGGKTYKTTYTLWFKEPSGLRVGDRVDVSGFLSAKVSEPWTGNDGVERRSVELGVNSPRIETGDAQPAQPAQQSPAPEPWDAGASNGFGSPESSEVPF